MYGFSSLEYLWTKQGLSLVIDHCFAGFVDAISRFDGLRDAVLPACGLVPPSRPFVPLAGGPTRAT